LSREKFPTKYFFEGNLAYQRKFLPLKYLGYTVGPP